MLIYPTIKMSPLLGLQGLGGGLGYLYAFSGAADTSYHPKRSTRFNSGDSAYLNRTLGSSGNRRTWTVSTWMKIVSSDHSAANHRNWFGADAGSASDASRFLCFVGDNSDFLQLDLGGASVLDSSSVYRDPTGWYHHVFALDTTTGSDASTQMRWYVNGKIVRTWTTETAQTADEELGWNNSASTHMIGANPAAGPGQWFDGRMSQFYNIDGLALGPSYFGYNDPLTNTWGPKEFRAEGTTVNDGTTWSDETDSGLTHGSGPAGMFDGSLSTTGGAPSTEQGYKTLVDNATISASSGIRIYWNGVGGGQRYIKINGTTVLDDGSAQLTPGWSPVSSFSGTINKIEVKTAASGSWSLSAIEVDGVIMKDSTTQNLAYGTNGFHLAMDPAETGTIYSDGSNVTADSSGRVNSFILDCLPVNVDFCYTSSNPIYGVDQIFGYPGGVIYTAYTPYSSSEYKIDLLALKPGVTITSLRVKASNGGYGPWRMTVLDSNKATITGAANQQDVTGSSPEWQTVAVGSGNSPQYLKLDNKDNSSSNPERGCWLHNIEINGEVLIDHTAIGHDSSGRGNHWHENNLVATSSFLPCVSFDGTGDYLAAGQSEDYNFGTGSFTIECFAYFNNITSSQAITDFINNASATGSPGGQFYFSSSNGGTLQWYESSTGYAAAAGKITPERWHHLAVVKNDSNDTIKIYIDGKEEGSSSHTESSGTNAGSLRIGLQGSTYFNGFISNLRILKGTALYTSGFTVPSAPLTNVTNTKLLCCQSSSSAGAAAVAPTISDFYAAGVHLNHPAATYTDRGGSNCAITNNGSITSSSAGTNSFGLTTAADVTGTQRIDINMGNVSGSFFQSEWTLEMFFKKDAAESNWFIGSATSGGSYTTGWSIDAQGGTLRWNYNCTGGDLPKDTGIAIGNNTWYFMRVQRTPSTSQSRFYFEVYDSPTNRIGSFEATAEDGASHSNNVLKIGDANGNSNNLSANFQFTNVMITAGTRRNQAVPTLVSGKRVLNASVTAAVSPYGDAVATNKSDGDVDLLSDVPGVPYNNGLNGGGNYCTYNPLHVDTGNNTCCTLSNGNLRAEKASGDWQVAIGTMRVSSGKWYWENTVEGNDNCMLGVTKYNSFNSSNAFYYSSDVYAYYPDGASKWNGNSQTSYGSTAVDGDIIGTALDMDNGKITFYKNGISLGDAYTGMSGSFAPLWGTSGTAGATHTDVNFGQCPFFYTNAGVDRPSAEYLSLNTYNLPSPEVVKPDQYVGVTTWKGNATYPRNIDAFNFQPDLVWTKNYTTNGWGWPVWDSVRGVGTTKALRIDDTGAEGSANVAPYANLSSLNSDGFTLSAPSSTDVLNGSGDGYAICWKAGGDQPISDLVFGVNTSDNGFDSSNTTRTYDTTSFSFASYSIPQSHPGGSYGANSAQVYKSSSGKVVKWKVSTSTAGKYIWTSDDGVNWTNGNGASQYATNTAAGQVISKWIALSGGANAASITVEGSHAYNVDDVGYASAAAAGLDGGTIDPSGASVGTKQGFAIIRANPDQAAVTISHGLGKKPAFIISKPIDSTIMDWNIFHQSMGTSEFIRFTDAVSQTASNYWGTGMDTTTFGIASGNHGNNQDTPIYYVWADVPGLQKFGSYEGSNVADGTFVELGFRPSVVIVKNIDATEDWMIFDSERSKYNPVTSTLYPNIADKESNATNRCDFLSNGFKLRSGTSIPNTANTHIYCAWAESPLKYSNAR